MINPNEVIMINQFPEVPANKLSLAMRKSVCGVGINDADYMVSQIVNGKQVACPIYRSWANMLERCYFRKFQDKNPTYADCKVCDGWLTFSNFRAWMLTQDWQGKELDKDIKIKGNKVYSPSSCSFVTTKENTTEALAKNYLFNNPNGEVVKIYNLAKFCRNNGLDRGTMSNVHLGKCKQHKGWTKAAKNEE